MKDIELYEAMNDAIQSSLADLHTITIAKVTKVSDKTINCQPVISRVVDGQKIDLPEFIKVPPIFMQGGSSYMSYPISVGDYCLLLFTERCFDRWYSGQDFQKPLEARMHDYSDGFAIVGVNPLTSAISIPSTTTINGDLIINGDVTINGDLQVNGTITASVDVVADGVSLKSHTHGGVTPGVGNTGVPN